MRRRSSYFGFAVAAVVAGFLLMIQFDLPALGGAAGLQLNPRDRRAATFTLDCTAAARPISPLIYGIGGSDNPWSTGATAVRHGGNPTSRYNWELDTWNAANDWFYKNVGGTNPGRGYD